MPYKDLEVRRAYMKRYSRDVLGRKPRVYRTEEEKKQIVRDRSAKWRRDNPDRVKKTVYNQYQKDYHTEWRHRLRRQVIEKYGGKCLCCGENEFWFLDIEHTDGGGKDHRSLFRDYISYLRHLLLNREDGIRVLCHNCNKARRHGDCPHDKGVALKEHNSLFGVEDSNNSKTRSDQNYRRRLRVRTVEFYGGHCACCGESEYAFLSIDHINGGGTKHIRSFNTYSDYLRWLLKEKRDGFQILCHNCNRGKARCGRCPHEAFG